MGLQRRSIQKLFREYFPGTKPLVVKSAERAQLGQELKERLERLDGVDTKDHAYVRAEEQARFVGSFTIRDNEAYYYYSSRASFQLLLDEDNRLTLTTGYTRMAALVSDLDEVVRFVRECKQRLQRQKALRTKRGKVRDLLAQAILAQVRKLAKEEQFDFMSETDAQKLKLFVKLSDEHAIEVHLPFKEFQQVLPQLRSAILALRQMYQSGIRFHIVGSRALPRRKPWIAHESL